MSVTPSPIGGFAAQFFDNNGVILSGGKIYTYAAGTTTPQATYTSAAGVTPHSNPIVLDSAGRVPGGEIWLTDGLVYKFVIETSAAILIGTYDNITGVNSNFINYTVQEEVQTATAGQTVFNLATINYTPGTNSLAVYIDGVNQYVGDSYLETDSTTVTFTSGLHVGAEVKFTTAVQTTTGAVDASIVSYDPPFTNSVATTVENKLAQYVSVKDFGAVGDGVADDTVAIQAALNNSPGGVYFPSTDDFYLVSDELVMADGTTVYGDGYKSQIRQTVQGKNGFVAAHDCVVRNLRVKMPNGDNLDLTKQNAVYIDGKKNVIVQDNWLELATLAVSGVQARGAAANITIKGNIIYGGLWTEVAGPDASASDILLYASASSSRFVIEGNYCLSNNSQGIFADGLGYNAELIIANNICVTLDPATCTQGGAWSEAASGGVRRHGIVLGYNNTLVDGPRAVVSGNLCRNTRWTGIYFQGHSEGRICSNNVCTNNGYEIGNTLSGGIYVIQNGRELIEGNLVLDFQNTTAATGGITINATTAVTEPSKISGNFVRNSAGSGIALGTNTALCEISDNTLIGNAGTDIYVVPNNLASNGGYFIADNNIYRTSGTNVPAISIAVGNLISLVTRIVGNKIRGFDNTTSNTNNVGIRCTQASSIYDIKNNIVENFYHGLLFSNYQTTNRNAQIESNTFVNCSVGISMDATTGNVTVPVVDNRFVNMLVSQTGAAIGGAPTARICTREDTRLVAQTYSAAPTNGDWLIGDRAMFTTPVAGGNIGAVCVTAGTPGTWKTYGAIAP